MKKKTIIKLIIFLFVFLCAFLVAIEGKLEMELLLLFLSYCNFKILFGGEE